MIVKETSTINWTPDINRVRPNRSRPVYPRVALRFIFSLQGVVVSQILLVDCSIFSFSLWEVCRMYHRYCSLQLRDHSALYIKSTPPLCFYTLYRG